MSAGDSARTEARVSDRAAGDAGPTTPAPSQHPDGWGARALDALSLQRPRAPTCLRQLVSAGVVSDGTD